MNLPPRPVLIAGGVGVAALAAFLWWRSRGVAAGPDESGDALGGSTFLFTPPAPLAAPGAGDWGGGAAMVTGGSTGMQASLTDALLQQDENAVQLGQAAQIAQLAERVIGTLPTAEAARRGWRYSAVFAPGEGGALAFDSQFLSGQQFITGGVSDSDVRGYRELAGMPGVTQSDLDRYKELFFFNTAPPSALDTGLTAGATVTAQAPGWESPSSAQLEDRRRRSRERH